MSQRIDTFDEWRDAYQVLDANLEQNLVLLMTAAYSDDPESSYQKAQSNVGVIYNEMKLLSLVGLKLIDAEIAASGVLETIAGLTAEAKTEIGHINDATRTVENLGKALGKAAAVVNKFMSLPFVSLV